jgi:hypothetical protein
MASKISLLSILLLTPCFALASNCDGAGNCYVRANATGDNSGSSWSNACTGFTGACNPSQMTRGVNYWVAAGSYGAQDFSAPVNGTTPITIMGAITTAGGHGPANDWNDSYAGQATFIGTNQLSTGYWIINGQAVPGCIYPEGNGDGGDPCYTMHFWNKTSQQGTAINIAANNITLMYLDIEGTGQGFPNNSTSDKCNSDDCGVWTDNALTGSSNNLYVGYSYVHHTGNTQFQMNNTPAPSNHLYEYNWVSYNHTGQNGHHDEAYSLYASQVVIRYNVFQDISGSGIITTAGAGQPALSNWDVYGNIFFWDATYANFNGQFGLATLDNAILDFLGEKMSGHITFENNTIAGIYNSVADGSGTAFSTLPISGLFGWSVCGSSCPEVDIYNNLWSGSAFVYGDYSPYCEVVSRAKCHMGYNTSYQDSVPSGDNWQTNSPPSLHDSNIAGNSNPFTDASASTVAGFLPKSPDPFVLTPGIQLGSPQNYAGLNQISFGANGVYDRGAEQLGSVSQQAVTHADPAMSVMH